MNSFGKRIRPAVDRELRAAEDAEGLGHLHTSFQHLERAHVLGQASTIQHVRVHAQMLVWARRHGRGREIIGQLLRIVGAATKTAVGWVPAGNTGGTNTSPFKPLPIPADLQAILEKAKAGHRT